MVAPMPAAPMPIPPPDDEAWQASLADAPPPPDVVAVLDTLGIDTPRVRPSPRADAPVAVPSSAGPVPDLNRIVERWDAVVDRLRADNHALVASLVEHAEPMAVAGSGVLTVKVDDATAEQALDNRKEAIVAALQAEFGTGITRVVIRTAAAPTHSLADRRVTTESVKADRLAKLRKRDPTLGQAIEELDLELLD